jgi:polyprenyl-phospho-N-acetylgalactosaminyl synthase
MVSVIIPAFNEEDTVASSVIAALQHPDVVEVLVVDDGSTDATPEVAAAAGARVVRLDRNAGKGAALDVGVRAARHDILLFLDADVTGHTRQSLSRIMNPVLSGRFEMYVGIRARSTYWLNWALHIFPIIGGDRALTRHLWDSVSPGLKRGFQIEIALNYTSKQLERGMGFELISGTRHRIKEQKYGAILGMVRRAIMIGHIVSVSFRLYVLRAAMRKLAVLGRRTSARGRA